MGESVAEFYERVREFADDDGRLPVPEQAMWEIFPFELESLRVKPLEPPVLPEPPRAGEAGRACSQCANPEAHAIWSDDRWVLSRFDEPLGLPFAAILSPREHLDLGDLDDVHACELGQLTVRVDRAARTIETVGRLHVNKWGDGGAHLHLVYLGRPAGLQQLRGSSLALWEEMLPRMPDDIALEGLTVVARALAEHSGRTHL